ncbi:LysR family transcriptional regulator [Nocardioides sp. GXZ039]|uniref:LysR family transcriptional regulator n=1 Tax=Nocardioides sp. GXZ039 TaxID=3136018 RepID=UPI0030F488AD
MDVRRLRLLLELSRLGSMRAVADEFGLTTSTVSQQIAALAREAGTALLEPDGRRVRLTAAGRRLADHAVDILAAVDAARHDLDPDAEPAGTVRVAGFASAIRRSLLPAIADLADTHPDVRVRIEEFEPLEAFERLARDDLDLALVYDYSLAPAAWPVDVEPMPLWTAEWGLGAPVGDPALTGTAVDVVAAHAERTWITNSRNTADEEAVRVLASMAGFTPHIEHQVDSLELVESLIANGLGVGLLPADRDRHPGVRVVPLTDPAVELRAYAVTRPGRSRWSPLRLLLDRLPRG